VDKVKHGEEIHYLDICSSYPYISKRGKFPIGHPRVYVGEDCPADCLTREGFIKCKVLPPRRLIIRPYRTKATPN
jgi:hypothetical protein